MMYKQVFAVFAVQLVLAPANALARKSCKPLLREYLMNADNTNVDQALVDCMVHPGPTRPKLSGVEPKFAKVSLPVLAHSTSNLEELPSRLHLAYAHFSMDVNTNVSALYHNFYMGEANVPKGKMSSTEAGALLCNSTVPGVTCVNGHVAPQPGLEQDIWALTALMWDYPFGAKEDLAYYHGNVSEIFKTMNGNIADLLTTYPTKDASKGAIITWSKSYILVKAVLEGLASKFQYDFMASTPVDVKKQIVLGRSD